MNDQSLEEMKDWTR